MNRMKLIAFDLDGTLLKDNKELTARTLDALRKASEAGIHLVPTTGRLYHFHILFSHIGLAAFVAPDNCGCIFSGVKEPLDLSPVHFRPVEGLFLPGVINLRPICPDHRPVLLR